MPWRKGNRLQLAHENEVSPQVAEIFDEWKTALGIGFVPLCQRSFACYPKFLESQWRALKPVVATREFFDLTARLRAEMYTYVHNYFQVPALGEGLVKLQAPAVLDSLAYVDSATMLLLSLQLQAFEGPTSQESMPHAADPMEATASPDFVDPETANAPVKRALDEIRHALDLPFHGDELKALAQWPDLLFAYWQAFKPSVQSIFHEQAIYNLRESAWAAAQEIPVEIDLEYARLIEESVEADEIAVITRLSELLLRGAANSLLNETFAKIGLEGGNQALHTSEEPEERVA